MHGLKLTELEKGALEWALDGHECAMDDENFVQDNPENAPIPVDLPVASWPAPDAEDILYRLEIQAPDMIHAPEDGEDPDGGVAFAKACRRTARKLRAAHPAGATLEAL
jgi:hypothetical protein